MQINQTTALRLTDKGYVTIVDQTCNKITGFSELHKEMERSICITGKIKSTLINYPRQLAHLVLHYNCFPLELDLEQVMDYMYLVKKKKRLPRLLFSSLPFKGCVPHAGCVSWSTGNILSWPLNLIKNFR